MGYKKGRLDSLVDGTFSIVEEFGGCLLKIGVLAFWAFLALILGAMAFSWIRENWHDVPIAAVIFSVSVFVLVVAFLLIAFENRSGLKGERIRKKRKRVITFERDIKGRFLPRQRP